MANQLTRGDFKELYRRADELHKDSPEFKRAANREFAIFLVLALALALAVRLFVFEPVKVSGSSMFPTLVHGERMFVQKLGYWFGEPERGDIIICYYPGQSQTCVKRVIGLPGDTVQVAGGKMLLNGQPLDESAYWNGEILGDTLPVLVPEEHVFVVGDNRNASSDSRHVGVIPYSKIVGQANGVIWPLRAVRGLKGA